MSEIWSELRRRNIFRVAVAYVVLSWVLLQLTGLVVPGFDLPGWTFRFVTFVLIIGFPLVLIFAWAFELTPEGLKRTADVDLEASVTTQTGRRVDFVIMGVLSVALIFFVVDRLVTEPSDNLSTPQGVAASSIAVLPFVNMSNDPDQVYFSDGISEEILNVLAQIPNLHVTSRSSAFQFRGNDIHIPDVAQRLGVANILEGSVRKSGTRIRVTAQLIDAATDSHLWTRTYDRELTDIFAIQDEISKAIVDALHVHLGLERPAVPAVRETDAEAYRLYLLGRHNFEKRTQDTLYKAIEFFNQAIAIDPGYAPAYSGKADALMLLEGYGDISRTRSNVMAEPLVQKAMQLDPEHAGNHVSKGFLLSRQRRYEASLLAYERAIEINPSLARAWHWRAISFEHSGNHVKATESWQRAHVLDPLSPVILYGLAGNHILFGRFHEAGIALDRLRVTAPNSYRVDSRTALFKEAQGDWSSAYTSYGQALEKFSSWWTLADLGLAQLSLKAYDPETPGFTPVTRIAVSSFGNPALAWQEYQSLPAPHGGDIVDRFDFFHATSRLGKHDETIEYLESRSGFSDDFPGRLFGVAFPKNSPATLLAHSRRKSGDEAGAAHLISETEKYIKVMNQQGATMTLPLLEAQVHAFKGDFGKAAASLRSAHNEGYLTWYDLDYAVFDDMRDRDDFQAIVRSVNAQVNVERAKLGWEPVK